MVAWLPSLRGEKGTRWWCKVVHQGPLYKTRGRVLFRFSIGINTEFESLSLGILIQEEFQVRGTPQIGAPNSSWLQRRLADLHLTLTPLGVTISPNKPGYVNKGMRRSPLKMYLTKERNHVISLSDQSWYISLCMVCPGSIHYTQVTVSNANRRPTPTQVTRCYAHIHHLLLKTSCEQNNFFI